MNNTTTWQNDAYVVGVSLLTGTSMRQFAGTASTASFAPAIDGTHVSAPATGDAKGIPPRGPDPV